MATRKPISALMPKAGTLLLTGSGKDFVARVGEPLVREAVLGVLKGENLRTQTEFLTRSRISQLSAALIVLYMKGKLEIENFTKMLSGLSLEQLKASKRNENADVWPAQWFIGLTGKSLQNVLKGDHRVLNEYVGRFEKSLSDAVEKAEKEYGPLHGVMAIAKSHSEARRVELGWRDVLQLATAIGAQTLTIRGSEKSMYGKLFERLVLGSVLTVLGYKRVSKPQGVDGSGVFWLSDGTHLRESDATLLYKPGHLVRFDIGFIGPGNPEISKDKLTRFAAEERVEGKKVYTRTIIVVDRLPRTSRTVEAARNVGAEIIQMSMIYWPRNLAIALSKVTGAQYQIQALSDEKVPVFLAERISKMSMADYLETVSLEFVQEEEE